jgi:hypothetical protein
MLWGRVKSCTAGKRTRVIQPVATPTELSQFVDKLALAGNKCLDYFHRSDKIRLNNYFVVIKGG